MRSDIIKRATDYWTEKRRDQRMPSRLSINPIDLADVLPNLVVAEAIDGGADYMHRIAGESAEKLLGADLHGARLSRLARSKASFASWRNGLDLARTFRAPHYATFESEDGETRVRAVFLPLSRKDGGAQADFVLSAVDVVENDPDEGSTS